MKKSSQPIFFILLLSCSVFFTGCKKKDYRTDFTGSWKFHTITTVSGSGGGTTTTDYNGTISNGSASGTIDINFLPSVTITVGVDNLGNLSPRAGYNITGNFSSKTKMTMDANNTGMSGNSGPTDYNVSGSR